MNVMFVKSRSMKIKYLHQHCKCLVLFSFLLILYVYVSSSGSANIVRKCYDKMYVDEHIELLEDVLVSKIQPNFGKSILFHETSCGNGIVSINARQACAIESAARANPNTDVFLLFASTVGFLKNQTKSSIIQALLSYTNVHMRNLNLWSYAKDTPINEFINTKKIFQSKYVTSHLSDFLRYLRLSSTNQISALTLFKWGGTYLDLDVVVKENLDSIENYAGAESEKYVAVGVMNVDNGGMGNHIVLECLKDFEKHFDGNSWGNNGPRVITRVLTNLCKSNRTSMMTRDRCHGFLVLKPSYIYSVPFRDYSFFFEEKYADLVLKITNGSFVVHVWNKLSALKPVRVGSNVAYGLLASKYCPKVYGSCGDYF